MGFNLASVDEMTGAIFTGAGTSMSMVWFLIAAGVCVVALWSGQRHEHEAYKKLKK
ncbi:MAG: hypothetical protein AAF393_03865 [Pseudomonadota bacterium]